MATFRVMIRNLHPFTTAKDLAAVFASDWSIRKIIVPRDPRKDHGRGYAFLDFDSVEVATLFIEEFDGTFNSYRTWQVGFADMMPPPARLIKDTVILYGLYPGTNEWDVDEYLADRYQWSSIHVTYDDTDRTGHPMAFIRLKEPMQAAQAIYDLTGGTIRGVTVFARYARKGVQPPQGGVYTLDVPGISDFIRIPPLESQALRAQRIARFQSHQSTLPQTIRWIPAAINWLDDAQDLLYTALILSKPLWRRLPARIVPGLGWLLIANDLLNLSTSLLAVPVSGRPPKRGFLAALDLLSFGRARRIEKFAAFMSSTHWAGFAIQGAQALRNITQYYAEHFTDEGREEVAAGRRVPGYGLCLGAWFGLVSEAFWLPARYVQGSTFALRLPPPADPLAKALRFLAQQLPWPHYREALSPEDHKLVTAAHAAAISIVRDSGYRPPIERLDELENIQERGYAPTNTASTHALVAAGVDVFDPDRAYRAWVGPREIIRYGAHDAVQGGVNGPAYPGSPNPPQLRWSAAYDSERWDKHAQHMQNTFGATPDGTWTSLATLDAALGAFGIADATHDEPKPNFAKEELAAMHAVEYGVLPASDATTDQVLAFIIAATKIAHDKGKRAADVDDLKEAAAASGMPVAIRPTLPDEVGATFEGSIGPADFPPGFVPPPPAKAP